MEDSKEALNTFAGAVSNASRASFGTMSFKNWTRFGFRSEAIFVTPVMLRPGCERLSANPEAIGSGTFVNTMGMLVEAFRAAATAGGDVA